MLHIWIISEYEGQRLFFSPGLLCPSCIQSSNEVFVKAALWETLQVSPEMQASKQSWWEVQCAVPCCGQGWFSPIIYLYVCKWVMRSIWDRQVLCHNLDRCSEPLESTAAWSKWWILPKVLSVQRRMCHQGLFRGDHWSSGNRLISILSSHITLVEPVALNKRKCTKLKDDFTIDK